MGLFSFNYNKEGPGIAKNAPKKRTFIVFFETFFRNFWKFAPISFVYSVISVFGVTAGLASSGMTHVARNTARDKHSFGFSDFFDTVKKNWKQSLGAGIINTLVYILLFFDIYYFYFSEGTLATVGLGISLSILFVFTVMSYYIWTLIITFNFSLKQVYKNSFKFVFINLKNNLICFFAQALVLGAYVGLLFLFGGQWLLVLTIELLIFAFTYPSFQFLLVQFCVFPAIRKYIIDPYYEEHPDDDIEKRRDLGLIEPDPIDEEENEDDEDSENVFKD